MQSDDRPIMLWHFDFLDYPLNGLALYKNQKVWFVKTFGGGWVNPQNSNEHKDLDSYYYDIESGETGLDGSTIFWKYPLYKLYEIPDQYLKQYENRHKLFQELVGYHTDHDPLIYQPFNTSNWSAEYKNNEWYQTEHPVIDYNPQNHNCLGEFRSWDFVNYYRPKVNGLCPLTFIKKRGHGGIPSLCQIFPPTMQ